VTEATRRAAAGDLDARVAVKGSDEVAVLGQGFNRMLEEIKASRDAIIEKKRLEAELEIAQVVQTSILPVTMPTRELRVAARMIPAAEVGGDYYDVLIRKDATWIGIGDVSGHGLTSGLMMMMVQSATSALTELVPDVRPSVCVSTVNRVMFDNVRCRMKGNDHMTFTLLRYLGNGRFQFAGGHEPMIVWRKHAATVEVIDTPGPWIGAQQDLTSVLPDSELTLAPGDRLVLFTDGITEAHTGDHRLFGIERLCEAVGKPADTVDQVVANVFREVDAFTSRRHDDQSIVVIERADD
jgi:sigma-B regulation protein RsbU (phosphoserine phosphatase)